MDRVLRMMNWNDFAVWHSPEEVIALASDEHASVCPKDLLNLLHYSTKSASKAERNSRR